MKKLITIFILIAISFCGCDKNVERNKLFVYRSENTFIDTKNQIDSSLRLFKHQSNVNIELVHYNSTDELNTKIMTGNGPDIIIMEDGLISDYKKIIQAGAFADLTKYIEKDKEITSDNYFTKVLDCGNFEGKQYIIPLAFTVPVAYLTDDNSKKYHLNIKKGETGFEVLENVKNSDFPIDKKPVVGVGWQSLFPTFLSYQPYDYKSGSVDINTDEFKTALELVKSYYNNNFLKMNDQTGFLIDSPLYSNKCFISGMYKNKAFNCDIVLLLTNDKRLNAYVKVSAAISSTCKDKKAAYKFVKQLMNRTYGDYYIPINRTLAYEEFRKMPDSEFYTDAPEGLMGKKVEEYISVIDSVDSAVLLDKSYSIIYEQFRPYFEDKVSLEDCIKQAEEKINIYLSE